MQIDKVRNEFMQRYPNRFDLHLLAILEHTNLLLDGCDIAMKSFGSKSFALDSSKWSGLMISFAVCFDLPLADALYAELTTDQQKWLVEVLSKYSSKDLDEFFVKVVAVFFEQQKQGLVFGLSHLQY